MARQGVIAPRQGGIASCQVGEIMRQGDISACQGTRRARQGGKIPRQGWSVPPRSAPGLPASSTLSSGSESGFFRPALLPDLLEQGHHLDPLGILRIEPLVPAGRASPIRPIRRHEAGAERRDLLFDQRIAFRRRPSAKDKANVRAVALGATRRLGAPDSFFERDAHRITGPNV